MKMSMGRSVLVVFGVFLSYFVLAWLSLKLAIPPGYAAGFWPPAGIAFAAVLIFGRKSLIGVYFGASIGVLTNLITLDPQTWSLEFFQMAAFFGCGASIQAFLASLMTRRFLGESHDLEETRSVFLFLTLGGPLACLISPSWGLTVLYSYDLVSWENLPMSYWHWWMGDTIGVVMFTPLIFVLFGQPRDVWRRRWAIVGWPAVVMILVLIWSFSLARSVDQVRFRFQFYQQAKDVFSKIEGAWERDVNTLEALQAFMDGERQPGSKEFYQFSSALLKNNRSIQGLAWAPRVNFEDKETFVAQVRKDNPRFKLREITKRGFVPAHSTTDEYFPLSYAVTLNRRGTAVGVDLGSDFRIRRAFDESRDTASICWADPSALMPRRRNKRNTLLVVLPVYSGLETPVSVEERREKLQGFVLGLFVLKKVLGEVVPQDARRKFEILIYGKGDGFDEPLVFKNLVKKPIDIPWNGTVQLGSQKWEVRVCPSDLYWQKNSAYVSRFVLLGALGSGFFLNAFLLIFAGRSARVERLVQERTVEVTQSNLFLDSLVDTIPDAIIARDANSGEFALLNRAGEDLIGQTQTELGGKTMSDILSKEEASRSIEQDRVVLAQKKLVDIEEEPFRFGKSERFMRTRKAPIFGTDGQVRYLLSISTDITKEREIRAALEASKERYAALIELAPDAFLIVNSKGSVLIVNSKAEDLFGYKRSEILGENVRKLFSEKDLEQAAWLTASQFDGAPREVVGRHKDGSPLPLELTLGSIENGDERLVVGAFRDTRLRRKAEIAVAQLQEIHHRVKNNLQIVHSLLRLQSRQVKDPKLEALLSESGSRIQAMALIHEHLYQSETVDRIQFGDFLEGLKQKLVQAYARQAKNLTVTLEGGAAPWLPIDRCVPAGLIVHELVLNGFRHAFPNDRPGEIRIGLKVTEDSMIELEVADNGVGFPEDKDFRNSSSLGLQLVNDLVHQLGGEIHLEVDGGSRFKARFPVDPNSDKAQEKS